MFAASKSGRAAASGSVVPFSYVPLLLETTSTNGQQNNTFLDSSTNNYTITRTGAVTQGSVTPYWPTGQWSNYFSSSYLSVADSASLRFGSGNFTIETWVFRTASGATHTIACKGSSAGPTGWVFQISSADKLVFIDTSTSITGTTSLAANTWYYVAVVRAGTGSSQTTLYLNGASDGTGTSATTFSQTDAMRIGTDRSAANGFAGYVSNLRLSNTNLTISSTPTTPLTALGSTIFLSCGYNRFVDGSTLASAITVGSGTPQVQAFQPFSPTASYTAAAYGGSGYFDGANTSNTHLRSPSVSYTNPSFTVECWFYFTGNPSGQAIFDFAAAANGYGMFAYIDSSTSNLSARFFSTNSGSSEIGRIDTPYAKYLSQWVHIAVVFDGTTYKMYLNGVSVGTPISSATQVVTLTTLTVGARSDATVGSGSAWVGYLSNFRYVRSTAVYTGNFTPPLLAPLTTAGSTSAASYSSTTNVNTSFASSNTVLLLNCTNAGIYDAAVQNNVTTVGDAQASTTVSKWSPTSMKFDGTGDWLTAVDNPQLQLGTGDFTIDGWVYLSATGVAYGIISKGTASTGWSVNVTSGNKLQFSYTASNLTGATSLASATWYYFAVVRSGSATGNLKVYLNGSVDATSGGAVTDNFNQTSTLYVGADRIGTSPLNGYLQDVRVTKYARTITTPTAAFPTR